MEFNEKGEIKKNFSIVGFVRDIKINFLDKYKIDKFNFTFEIKEQNSNFENIQVSLNNIPFLSKKIALKKANDHLYIEGEVENKDIDMDKKNINLFINPLVSVLDIKKINFNSKNKFSFKILKKFNIENFKLSSKIILNELKIENNTKLEKIFPKIKKEIKFNNHLLNIDYSKKDLAINGNGKILLQDNEDKIKYSISKKNKNLKFSTFLNIKNNEFMINFLNYKKKESSKLDIKLTQLEDAMV